MSPSRETIYPPSAPEVPDSAAERLEAEISPEDAKALSDQAEAAAFYRGLPAKDALYAAFGRLKLNAHPPGRIAASRDNASLNLAEALPFAPTSSTRDGRKFLCTIGFDPLPPAKIEDSFLGRHTSRRITGPVLAREIIIRFGGSTPGRPAEGPKFLSPREFYEFYLANMA